MSDSDNWRACGCLVLYMAGLAPPLAGGLLAWPFTVCYLVGVAGIFFFMMTGGVADLYEQGRSGWSNFLMLTLFPFLAPGVLYWVAYFWGRVIAGIAG